MYYFTSLFINVIKFFWERKARRLVEITDISNSIANCILKTYEGKDYYNEV